MRVKYNNKVFDVRFRYEFGGGPSLDLLNEVSEVKAQIKDLKEELEELEAQVDHANGVTTHVSIVNEATKEMFTGVAWKHPNDNHCRSAARAEALKCATACLDKEERAEIYEAWMNRPDSNGTI